MSSKEIRFILDVRKSVSENAQDYYAKSKKAKEKIKGAKKALENTKKELEQLSREDIEIQRRAPEETKKRKKKWYEKFRFFFSSDNYLVIGGKDATTNEILIKKHTQERDLVFHGDFTGAPFFVIKNSKEGDIPDSTLHESAQAAASYSKAWKAGYGAIDVYAIEPDQVSKDAPAGEFLGKGAFMIYGKKRWFRKTELKLAIGIRKDERDVLFVEGGPVPAIDSRCKYYVIIKPGDRKSKELAKKIKGRLLNQASKDLQNEIEKINLQDIQHWIPAGKGSVE